MRQKSEVSGGHHPEDTDAEARLRRGPRFADRYALRRLLKQGNGVTTFLAVDDRSGEQVVVKTFETSALQSSRQARFVHETRVLRELSGLGVCALHDAGQRDGQLYLAQRF